MVFKKFVSIIIPTYNDAAYLKKALRFLLDQSYPKEKYEVILVDDGSDDDTEEVVNSFLQQWSNKNLRYVKQKRSGSYVARNKGICLSKGEIIGFTDADCLPLSDWVERAADYFETDSSLGILQGRIKPDKNNKRVLLYHTLDHKSGKYNYSTGNLFTRRTVFDSIGLFDSEFKWWGDLEFTIRSKKNGVKGRFAGEVTVVHRITPLSVKEYLFDRGRIPEQAKALSQIIRKHPEMRSEYLFGSIPKRCLFTLLFIVSLPLFLLSVALEGNQALSAFALILLFFSVFLYMGKDVWEESSKRIIFQLIKFPVNFVQSCIMLYHWLKIRGGM